MKLIDHTTFEQAIFTRLIKWKRTRRDLEREMKKPEPGSANTIDFRIEKLDAKLGAALFQLEELGAIDNRQFELAHGLNGGRHSDD